MGGLLIFSAYYKKKKKIQAIGHHRKGANKFMPYRIKKGLKNSVQSNILWRSASKFPSLWRKPFQVNVQKSFASFSKGFINFYFKFVISQAVDL